MILPNLDLYDEPDKKREDEQEGNEQGQTQSAAQGNSGEQVERLEPWEELVKTDAFKNADVDSRLRGFEHWLARERGYYESLKDQDPEAYSQWKQNEAQFNDWADRMREEVRRSDGNEILSTVGAFMQGSAETGLALLESGPRLASEYARHMEEKLRKENAHRTGIIRTLADITANIYGVAGGFYGGVADALQEERHKTTNWWRDTLVKGRPETDGEAPLHEKIAGSATGTMLALGGGAAGVSGIMAITGLQSFAPNFEDKLDRVKKANPSITDAQARDMALASSLLSTGAEVTITGIGGALGGTLEAQFLKAFRSKAATAATGQLSKNAQKFDEVAGDVIELTAEKVSPSYLRNVFSKQNLLTLPGEVAEENAIVVADYLVDRYVLGLKDREKNAQGEGGLWEELTDTTLITAITSGLLTPAALRDRGINAARLRENLKSYTDAVFNGEDPALKQYMKAMEDAQSAVEYSYAEDTANHIIDRAHWIKQQLGETENVDPERAARYVNVTEAAAARVSFLAERVEGLRDILSRKSQVAEDAERILGPEVADKLRQTDQAIAEKAMADALAELEGSEEKQRLDDEFNLAKFGPADLTFSSPEERAATAARISEIVKNNAGLNTTDLRALVAKELAGQPQDSAPQTAVPETPDEAEQTTPPTEVESNAATEPERPSTPTPAPVSEEPTNIRPASEMVGHRGRYEGYEGVVVKDGARFLLVQDVGPDVELPADAEVELVSRRPASLRMLGGDPDAEVTPPGDPLEDSPQGDPLEDSPQGDLLKDFPLERRVKEAPVNLELEGAKEIVRAVFDTPEVYASSYLIDLPLTEALDEDGIAVARGAKQTLEKGIRDIEVRKGMSDEDKRAVTEPLYAHLIALDEALTGRGLDPENLPDPDMVARGRELGFEVPFDIDEVLGNLVEVDETEDVLARLRDVRARMIEEGLDPTPVDEKIATVARTPDKANEVLPPRKKTAKKAPAKKKAEAKKEEAPKKPEAEAKKEEALPVKQDPNAHRKNPDPVPEVDEVELFHQAAVQSLAGLRGETVEQLENRFGDGFRKMANTVAKYVRDAFTRAGMGSQSDDIQDAIRDALYGGATLRDHGTGLRQNVLADLVENYRETGDPFRTIPKNKRKKKDDDGGGGGEEEEEGTAQKRKTPVSYQHSGTTRNAIRPYLNRWGKVMAGRRGQSTDEQTDEDSTDTVGDKMVESVHTPPTPTTYTAARRQAHKAVREILDSYRDQLVEDVMAGAAYAKAASNLTEDEVTATVAAAMNKIMGAMPGAEGVVAVDEKADALVNKPLLKAIVKDGAKIQLELVEAIRQNVNLRAEADEDVDEEEDLLLASVDTSSPGAFLESIGRGLNLADAKFTEAVEKAKTTEELSDLLWQMNQVPAVRAQLRLIAQARGIKLQPDGTPETTDANMIRLLGAAQDGRVLEDPNYPAPVRAAINKLSDAFAKNAEAQFTNPGDKALFKEVRRQNADIAKNLKVVFDPFMLTPTEAGVTFVRGYWYPAFDPQTGQRLVEGPGSATVYVSPFLSAKDRNAVILHEMAHAVLDTKVRRYEAGQLHLLTDKEIEALRDLKSLWAQTRAALDKATDLDERTRISLERATSSLNEFVSEVWGDERVRNFMAGIKAKKGGLLRRAIRRIYQLFTGRSTVADDSLLAQTLNVGLELAKTRSPQQIREVLQKDATRQAAYFVKRTGMTPDEVWARGLQELFNDIADEYRARNARLSEVVSEERDPDLDWAEDGPEASISISFEDARRQTLAELAQHAVPEDAPAPLFEEGDYDKAFQELMRRINDSTPIRARGRHGNRTPKSVNMRSPDPGTASYRGLGEDELTARAHHALTMETDRKTPQPEKIRFAANVPNTVRFADLVGRKNVRGKNGAPETLFYFSKLYTDPKSPTGQAWHVVVTDANGNFISQYSNAKGIMGKAGRAEVASIGEKGGGTSRTEFLGFTPDRGQARPRAEGPLDTGGITLQEEESTTPEELQQQMLDAVANLAQKRDRLLAAKKYEQAAKVDEQIKRLEGDFDSAGAASLDQTAPAFVPMTFDNTKRARTAALKRAREAVPEIDRALRNKTYIAQSERETLQAAHDFIDSKGGDLFEAFKAARPGLATGLSPEQVHAVQALALRGLNDAAAAIGRKLNSAADLGTARGDLELARQLYREQADIIAETLEEQASQAGSELRAYRLVADLLTPQQWVKIYQKPTVKAAAKNQPVIRLLERAEKSARAEARKNMLGRMKKVLDAAGARYLPKDLTEDEMVVYRAQQRLAHLIGSPRPIREQIADAAAEAAAAGALSRIRKLLAGSPVEESLLDRIRTDVTRIARKQADLEIDKVFGSTSPELSEAEKVAAAEEKIKNLWREVGKLPLAEQVFNSAVEGIRKYAPKEAGILRDAKFDYKRANAIRKAVLHSIVLSDEIRLSVGERGATVETLIARLKAANPELDPEFDADPQQSPLSDTAYEKIAKAVEAVYNEEVRKAMDASLQRILDTDRDAKLLKSKLDRSTIQRILPYINMGAFQRAEVYNVLAEKFRLPKWDPATADRIREMAEELQQLPYDSYERDAAAQRLGLEILKAHIRDAGGVDKIRNIFGIAGAVWTAGVLSGLQTHLVNAAASGVSVFLESLTQATGHALAARQEGATLSQSLGFYRDAMAAWRHVFGKTDYGTRRGLTEAAAAWKTGTNRAKSEAQEELSILEAFTVDKNRPLNPKNLLATYKYVGRAMLAADGVNSLIGDNAKRRMMLRALALAEGKTEEEIEKIVSGPNTEDIKAANEIVEAEREAGYLKTKLDVDMRREQLLDRFVNSRLGVDDAEGIKRMGREFAAYATFNNDAYGMVGMVLMESAARLNRMTGGLTRPLVPFPRTVSNLVNSVVSYTPYGFARAFNINFGSFIPPEQYRRRIDWDTREGRIEGYAMMTRATAGSTALLLALHMVMAAFRDRREGKEPWFEIVGNGPSDPAARKQWLASGFKPFHIRIGKQQFRYTDWPALGIVLGAVGTAYDRMIEGDDENLWTKAGPALMGAVATVFDRNMLSGANELFKMLSENTSERERSMAARRLMSSYVSGFTQPQIIRWLGQMATGKVNEQQSLEGWLIGQTPLTWFRDKPVLNILGEPVKAERFDVALGRFTSPVREHPILTPLTRAGLTLPVARKEKVVDYNTGKARDLTDEEWYEFQKIFGQTLKEQLSDPDFVLSLTEMDPDIAEDIITSLGIEARAVARETLGLTRATKNNTVRR